MALWIGTSGFAFGHWRGRFYPEPLPGGQLLPFYARHLSAVEINNTFYRPPAPEVVARWCEQVPDDFRFILKVPAEITHAARLVGVEEKLSAFLQSAAELQAKLGALLFQLPPSMPADIGSLRRTLELLPRGLRVAFEFRHRSWFSPEVARALLERGKAFALTDRRMLDGLPGPEDWGYLRFPGVAYAPGALASLLEAVQAKGWREAFVIFREDVRLPVPLDALRFAALARGERRSAEHVEG